MAAKLEVAGVEAAEKPSRGRFGPLAFKPEDELVAGALEGDARPAPASDLLKDEAGEMREGEPDRLEKGGGGVGQRRRRGLGGRPSSRSTRSI